METIIDLSWRPPVLETARLWLRPIHAGDAPALFSIAKNPAVTHFTLWEAHRTLDESRSFIDEYANGRYLEGVPDPYAIVLKDSDKLIGAIGCHWATQANHCMELGYWLGEPFWGRGLATEAARAIVAHLFAAYPVERVQAHVIEGNASSRRVLEKIGLRFEGTKRRGLFHRERFWDLHGYAVLRGEWKS